MDEATVERAARAHSPSAWRSMDEWFRKHSSDDHPYHGDMVRTREGHLSAMRAALAKLERDVWTLPQYSDNTRFEVALLFQDREASEEEDEKHIVYPQGKTAAEIMALLADPGKQFEAVPRAVDAVKEGS